MGQTQSFVDGFVYHTPVSKPANPEETAVFRSSSHPDELITTYRDKDFSNGWHLFANVVKKSPNRRFLGRRFRNTNGELGGYEWMSYGEAHQIVLAFGTALTRCNLIETTHYPEEVYEPARQMKVLGIYAKNCVEWFLSEQACNAYGYTLCPIYDTLGQEAMCLILTQSKLSVCLVAFECLGLLVDVLDLESSHFLKTIILIDPAYPEDASRAASSYQDAINRIRAHKIDVLMWHEVVSRGVDPLPPTPAPTETLNTLCYTSGTTGLPKAVLITHRALVSSVIGGCRGPVAPAESSIFSIGPTDCHISYLPLAHVFERCVSNIVMEKGAAIGVYSGDMTKLMDDIKVLQPTIFISVPRLFNRINDKIAMSLQDKKTPTQMLFNQGLNSKINRRRNTSNTTHRVWDAVVFNKIRNMMGGRLRGMISGGAPLDPVICERMTCFFGVPVAQGYGLSESFGACFLMHVDDPAVGCSGGVWPAVEFKLISVPELGYSASDQPSRGELLLRGPGIAPGYFLNKECTQESWDADGWFHTGDICELHEKTLALRIIDRRKNFFKLAQGEYVAPEKIESVYSQSLLVQQIFVHGYSNKTCLVAVVVPDFEMAERWATKNNCDYELESLCQNYAFKQAVFTDMDAVAKKLGLKGFEKAKEISLTPEPFTVENNLLTPTSKVKRNECLKVYKQAIDDMYAAVSA